MARKFALVIGNSRYDDPNLGRLKAPDVDVLALESVLKATDVGRFDDVITLRNEGVAAVRKAIAVFYDQRKSDDLLFFYFSGHGVKDEQGHLYLALRDTELSILAGTAVESAFVSGRMDRSHSKRQVVVLDCCHSGAFANGTKSAQGASVGTAEAFEGTGMGRVILTATDATQYAWEGDRVTGDTENSLFTHYLIEGLRTGAADQDADGVVTVDELFDYVRDQVLVTTPRQTPLKWSYRQQGSIILAQNPFAAPSALPGKLADAIASKFPNDRFDAVRELDALLRGDDVGQSRAALAALKELTQDDSRKVATAATDVLKAYEGESRETRREPPPQPRVEPAYDRWRREATVSDKPDDGSDDRRSDVFLSYAHQDRESAKALAGVLIAEGWQVWWDRKIAPGESFDIVIERELRTCRCAIVLWSVHSVDATWVRNEARRAARRKVLVPILIDEVEPPLEFENLQAADLTAWHAPESHPELDTVLGKIRQLAPIPVERLARAAVEAARRQFASGDQPGAVASLARFRPEHPIVTSALGDLRAEANRLEKERAAAEDARARQAVESAEQQFATGDHEGPIATLAAFRPEHALVTAALAELRTEAKQIADERADAARQKAEAERREKAEAERREKAEAERRAKEAAERQRALEAEQARAAEEKRAKRLVEIAREQFAGGDHEGSIARLSAYRPEHPLVTTALGELQADAKRIADERAEAARQKAEAERREKAEAARRAKAEAERREKAEAERRAKEAAERQRALEAEQARAAEEKRAQEAKRLEDERAEAARREKAEAERREKAEAERRAKAEAERRAKEAAERQRALEAEQARAAEDKQAQKAVETARQQFAGGDHEGSIATLAGYRPEHALVTAALAELRTEAKRIADEVAEAARQKAEAERREKAEAARREKAEAERRAKAEAERREKAEAERLAKEAAERQRVLEAEQARAAEEKRAREAKRLEDERAEAARKEKAEAERREKAEAARLAKEAADRQKALDSGLEHIEAMLERGDLEAAERALDAAETQFGKPAFATLRDQWRTRQAKAVEQARIERERVEQLRLEREHDEQVRIERERAEKARLERERLEKARLEQQRVEKARLERERAEAARREQEAAERPQGKSAERPQGKSGVVVTPPPPAPRSRAIYVGIGGAAIIIVLAAGLRWGTSPAVDDTPVSPPATDKPDNNTAPPQPSSAAGPVQPAPSPTPPDKPPVEPRESPELAKFRSTASQEVKAGNWEQALAATVAGMRLDPKDAELTRILNDLLGAARSASDKAKQDSIAAGRDLPRVPTFSDGLQKEAAAVRYQRAGRTDAAIPSYRAAAEAFVKATGEYKQLAAQEAARQAAAAAAAEQARLRQQAEAAARVAAEQKNPTGTEARATQPPAGPPAAASGTVARVPSDEDRIRQVLNDYVDAYAHLNVGAIVALQPGAPQRQLETAFKDLRSYTMNLRNVEISVSGNAAVVRSTLDTELRYIQGRTDRGTRAMTLRLERRGTGWVIVQRQ